MTRPAPTNAHRADGTPFYRGGCATGMPRRGACHLDCRHRSLIENYRDARASWENRRENEDAALDGPRMEDSDYREALPPPTFKAWLIANRGQGAFA